MTRAAEPKLAARATIRCSGGRHPIGLSEQGEVVLLGHEDKEVDRHMNYAAIGGAPCACVAFMLFWRDLARGTGVRAAALGFAPAVGAYNAATAALAWNALAIGPLADRPLSRRPEFLGPFVRRLLRDCCALPREIRPKITPSHRLVSYEFRLVRGREVLWQDWIEFWWADQVFRAGLAVVEGVLTLRRTHHHRSNVVMRGGHRVERVVLEKDAGGAFAVKLARANVVPSVGGLFQVEKRRRSDRRHAGGRRP